VSGDFRAVGREFAGYLVDLGGLGPDDAVIDIGCRAGRTSIPLIGYLSENGRYEAVDDWPEATMWCQQAITGRHTNFHFRHLDMGEGPAGAVQARTTSGAGGDDAARSRRSAPAPLPYPDGSFDMAILGSILQLNPVTFDLYLAEAARVTRPGGTYFGTWYLKNEARTGGVPAAGPAIACTEATACARLRSVGLAVEAIHRGSWDGYDSPLSYQDVVIARKMSMG
jgi:SAM-dependent methyltransferase